MHWEKLQEQHRNEASKSDIEAIRRKQEAEKRKKKELEERQERERLNKSLEIKELQDRRKSLAEAWEIKNNNNDEAVSPLKKNELTPSKSKKESSKTSPRKSPRKKKVGLIIVNRRMVWEPFVMFCSPFQPSLLSNQNFA